MDGLITVRRPLVLRRPDGFASAEIVIRVQRPVRITQQLAGQENDIRLTGAQNVFGLSRLGDHSYGASRDFRFLANPLGEAGLITRPSGNFRIRRRAAGRNIDQVHTQRLEPPRQLDGFIGIPAVLHPVSGRNPDKQRQLFGPHRAHRFGDLQHQADAIFE